MRLMLRYCLWERYQMQELNKCLNTAVTAKNLKKRQIAKDKHNAESLERECTVNDEFNKEYAAHEYEEHKSVRRSDLHAHTFDEEENNERAHVRPSTPCRQ